MDVVVDMFGTLMSSMEVGFGSYTSATGLDLLSTIFGAQLSDMIPIIANVALGQSPSSAMLTSTYNSFHSFLIQGMGNTAFFQGFSPSDSSALDPPLPMTIPPNTPSGLLVSVHFFSVFFTFQCATEQILSTGCIGSTLFLSH